MEVRLKWRTVDHSNGRSVRQSDGRPVRPSNGRPAKSRTVCLNDRPSVESLTRGEVTDGWLEWRTDRQNDRTPRSWVKNIGLIRKFTEALLGGRMVGQWWTSWKINEGFWRTEPSDGWLAVWQNDELGTIKLLINNFIVLCNSVIESRSSEAEQSDGKSDRVFYQIDGISKWYSRRTAFCRNILKMHGFL